jgi:hypothetical protein
MSPIARTNIIHSQLIQLVALQATSNSPAQPALRNSFILLLEQGLCALVRELAAPADSARNDGGLSALLIDLDDDINRSALVRSIRNGQQDSDHWLHYWSTARQHCFQPPAVASQVVAPNQSESSQIESNLIPMVDREHARRPNDCVSWLQGFADLVFSSRSLNNYD